MEFKGLFKHQEEALRRLRPGSILCGGVGSGKTLTGLAFYQRRFGNAPLYVITTAKKRDTGDWEREAALLGIENLVVDSWNNIEKYKDVRNAFFIFDEQRVVGSGAWVKNFLKITTYCRWIILSATPGDVWMDYVPVFLANGFYRNKTDFISQHVEYNRFAKFPQVKKYHNQAKLEKYRKSILVLMPDQRTTVRHREYVDCTYDEDLYNYVVNERRNIYNDYKPAKQKSEVVQVLRRILSTTGSRINELGGLLCKLDKAIVFYNYDYELEIIRELCELLGKDYSEWNGHKHQDIPTSSNWAYLVQYTAGAEGWNCTETNKVIFYSLNYSYRITEQAEGRIDRLDTPFKDLYYYYLMATKAPLDKAIKATVRRKKKFNERQWVDRAKKSERECFSVKPYTRNRKSSSRIYYSEE